MDCLTAHRAMHAWLDGELPPEKARGMADHVRGCPACAARLGELSALFDALGELPGPGPAPDLARATVRAAAAETPAPVPWFAALPALYKGTSFAAVAAGLFLGIFLYYSSPFGPTSASAGGLLAPSSVMLTLGELESQ